MAAGRRSNSSRTASAIFSGSTVSRAERLDQQRDGVGDADGVGHLDLAALGRTGGHDVLGHPARRVGGRAVHLRRVLAREGTAAVPGHAAVGVHDDLAAGQPGVGVRPTQLEDARSG